MERRRLGQVFLDKPEFFTQHYGVDSSPVALSTLPVGAEARVDRIGRTHPLRRRLLELGFVRGALVRVVRRAPLGDPLELTLGGTHLALRAAELEDVWVRP